MVLHTSPGFLHSPLALSSCTIVRFYITYFPCITMPIEKKNLFSHYCAILSYESLFAPTVCFTIFSHYITTQKIHSHFCAFFPSFYRAAGPLCFFFCYEQRKLNKHKHIVNELHHKKNNKIKYFNYIYESHLIFSMAKVLHKLIYW